MKKSRLRFFRMFWGEKKRWFLGCFFLGCFFLFGRVLRLEHLAWSEEEGSVSDHSENLKQAEEESTSNHSSNVLQIQDMEITTLLNALALRNKVNIVSTPEVSGKVSLNLSNAGLEDTLTAVTKSLGLSWTKDGSIYIVSKKETHKEGNALKPIISIFSINYADLKELSKIIQWSFEGLRVNIYTQERLMLVEAKPEDLPEIRRIITSLDLPPRQVLIEAQILEINLSDDTSYGIDWGNTFSESRDLKGQINSPSPQFPPNTVATDPSQFFFGLTKPSYYVKLSALEKKGDVKTLATPRLMVLDNKAAQILIGGRLGYYLTTTTETSTLQSVEFLEIGTQLKLLPQISVDGHIIMTINPEVSDGAISGGLPQKTTTSVSTSIMVKEKETIFIGGLIRTSEIKTRNRLPLLGRIPWLGPIFFSKASTQVQKKELVILLTPSLVSTDGVASLSERLKNNQPIDLNLKNDMEKWQKNIQNLHGDNE